jgi:hypothetical protein
MGLKRDSNPGVPGEAGSAQAQPAAQTPPKTKTPPEPKKATKKAPAQAAPAEGRQAHFRCTRGFMGDPITCIKYGSAMPMPGVIKEGNWIDAQVKAGVLVEVQMPEEK